MLLLMYLYLVCSLLFCLELQKRVFVLVKEAMTLHYIQSVNQNTVYAV